MSDDAKMAAAMGGALVGVVILLVTIRLLVTSMWSRQTCYPMQPIEYIEHGTWIGAV